MSQLTEYINEEEVSIIEVAKGSACKFVEIETTQDRSKIQEWATTYFHKSCGCSHDCCGHWFTSCVNVMTKWEKGQGFDNVFIIEVSYAKNE